MQTWIFSVSDSICSSRGFSVVCTAAGKGSSCFAPRASASHFGSRSPSAFAIPRAAKDGYLTVSDDRGRILARKRSDSAPFATLIADMPAVHDSTLYLLLGDWFAWLVLATLVFTLAQLYRLRKHAPQRKILDGASQAPTCELIAKTSGFDLPETPDRVILR